MFDRFIEDALQKAHPHARKLRTTAVQKVEHHLDAGTSRLKSALFTHPHVDAVASVRDHVEAEVLIVLLDHDVLVGISDIANEEVDVTSEAAVVITAASRHEPEIRPSGKAAPVFHPADVVAAVGCRRVMRLHAERIRAKGWLGDHEPAHVLLLQHAFEHLAAA